MNLETIISSKPEGIRLRRHFFKLCHEAWKAQFPNTAPEEALGLDQLGKTHEDFNQFLCSDTDEQDMVVISHILQNSNWLHQSIKT